jgi:hypothetical protein
MCLLRSRVRSPSSAGRRPAGNVPGEAEVGETADLSRIGRRESRGEALTAVYLSHRVSAGPPRSEPHTPQAYSGKDLVLRHLPSSSAPLVGALRLLCP